MPRSKASNEAQYRYNQKHLKRIPLDVQQDYYNDILLPAVKESGDTVNGFIKTAISEKIDRLHSQV